MKIIRSINHMRQITGKLTYEQKDSGFVPTMGYLHDGHLTLMKQARQENDIVIASIFVNPLQFAPGEDFEQYPRDEARDEQKAKDVGVDFLFMPDAAEMYPDKMAINVTATQRVDVLCGKSRQGHFDGVATVLSKLFHIVAPDRAYFGMKDAQQLAVVAALIRDLNFPIELRGIATVRDEHNLALSSRNVYLSEQERLEAQSIHRALIHGQQAIIAGEKNPETIVKQVTEIIKQNTQGPIDYVAMLSYPTLQPITEHDEQIIIACAVHFTNARLIDNIIMNQDGQLVEALHMGTTTQAP